MKRRTIIIIGVIFVVLIAVILHNVISIGSDASGLAYINIAVNPKIDFVAEREIIVSYYPLNEEARELCAQEDFIGLHVDQAVQKFLDLCARTGYLDLEKTDNVVRVECVAGLKQVLENKVYKSVNDYLIKNQILGVIVEASNDNAYNAKAKKQGVGVDNLSLIEGVLAYDPNLSFDELKEKSRGELVEKIKNYQQKLNPQENYTQEQLTNKRVLIDFNRLDFARHQSAITNETQRDFKQIFLRNERNIRNESRKDFDGAYQIWKTNHINFVG